jgi:putative membrane protein
MTGTGMSARDESASPTGIAHAVTPTDHLANERTFLAWVRTSITIMAFGFVVAKFGLLLRELSGSSSGTVASAPISEATGVLLVLAGAALLVLAFVRFRATREDLDAGRYRVRAGLEWALTLTMVAIGIGLAAYLVSTG